MWTRHGYMPEIVARLINMIWADSQIPITLLGRITRQKKIPTLTQHHNRMEATFHSTSLYRLMLSNMVFRNNKFLMQYCRRLEVIHCDAMNAVNHFDKTISLANIVKSILGLLNVQSISVTEHFNCARTLEGTKNLSTPMSVCTVHTQDAIVPLGKELQGSGRIISKGTFGPSTQDGTRKSSIADKTQ
ncbi:hypothetical protein BS50DRAFT_570228 [Corynespora cassiicola Philippines]|uniref:Uncharacterized protein n=1 Tax=Corynespora cassiicola Philippines TaxID=1448308 RepID=A0A2T2NZ60_CORCC|nr:hypothetical protein BS50DRAFT_570228 [Corynespora cassiicola Philippines]